MYNKIKQIGKENCLAEKDGVLYTLRRIPEDDLPIFRRLCSVRNPHLAPVEETIIEDDALFAVTRYIEGETLTSLVERNGNVADSSDLILSQVCEGLSALHAAGIVHRDINPDNIIMTALGPVIIDYGISRITKGNKSADTSVLGTVGYCAPEQFGFRETDCRADIYSAGVLYNYLITGFLPSVRKAGGNAGNIVDICTRLEPASRYQSADELRFAVNPSGVNIPRVNQKKESAKKLRIVAYAVYGFYLVLAVVAAFTSEDKHKGLEAIGMLTMFFIGPLFMCNFFRWQDKVPVINKMNRFLMRTVMIVLGLLISLLGTFFFDYVANLQ